MIVVKRNGRKEPVNFSKITARIQKECYGLSPLVDPIVLSKKVIEGVYDGVKTSELDDLAANISATNTIVHPDYAKLAARIAVSNLQKNTKKVFSEVIEDLYSFVDPKTDKKGALIADDVYETIMKNKDTLNAMIVYHRDFNFDYFGFKTLEKSYLLKLNGKIVERPQHMIMRVAVGIHLDDIESVRTTYEYMSEKYFTHATPTLFNAGTPKPQMSSCFLLTMKDDSINGIFDTLSQTAKISQSAGGIGLSVHNVRAKGSYIRGTNGTSNGIVPMLRVFNDTARYVDQGGGKRKGSFAIYLEPWHADIFDFLEMKRNNGKEEFRARDLFYALWIPDLFMSRVIADEDWSLLCPDESPGLSDVYGEEFVKLYTKYESEGRAKKTIKARELWEQILKSQVETGTPYMLYKDSINNKSNQKNVGTIKSSNLCTEIVEYTSPDEVAVCNLASLSLPKFMLNKSFDHKTFYKVVKVVTKNLNRIIDRNYYPVPEAKYSNLRHRPIGLGVQGLADVFAKARVAFDSEEARKMNKEIFETLYFASLEASCELAEKEGAYTTYEGSPISQGIFQYEMWGLKDDQLSGLWNWGELRQKIKKSGVRNSLLVAPMPTASTAQIMGNNECFEPFTSNVYSRETITGTFIQANKYLLNDLVERDLWNDKMKSELISKMGSIQNIENIPDDLKKIYKTVWEIPMKSIIDMAADRGAFIDQSQSMNLFVREVTSGKLSSMHKYAWEKGLKTGMYYLRTESASDPNQVTVDRAVMKNNTFNTETKTPEIKDLTSNSGDSIGGDSSRENTLFSSTNSLIQMEATSPESVKKEEEQQTLTISSTVSNEEMQAAIACSLDNPDDCISCQ